VASHAFPWRTWAVHAPALGLPCGLPRPSLVTDGRDTAQMHTCVAPMYSTNRIYSLDGFRHKAHFVVKAQPSAEGHTTNQG
jgi:hypothetical protein